MQIAWVHLQKPEASVLSGRHLPTGFPGQATSDLATGSFKWFVGFGGCGNHGGGWEGVFLRGQVREGFPLKNKLFSELQAKPQATTWPDVNSLETFYFSKFPGEWTGNFHISMAFMTVWKVFPTLLYYPFPAPPSNSGERVSQRSFLWKSLPTHQNKSFSLQCCPQLCCHISALAHYIGKEFCPLSQRTVPPYPLFQYINFLQDVALFHWSLHSQQLDQPVGQRWGIKVSSLLCCINHVLFLL